MAFILVEQFHLATVKIRTNQALKCVSNRIWVTQKGDKTFNAAKQKESGILQILTVIA